MIPDKGADLADPQGRFRVTGRPGVSRPSLEGSLVIVSERPLLTDSTLFPVLGWWWWLGWGRGSGEGVASWGEEIFVRDVSPPAWTL